MSRFRFRLQRVLQLRADIERSRAVALSQATQEAQTVRSARDEIAALCDRNKASLQAAPLDRTRIGSLQQMQFMLTALDARLAAAEGSVVTAHSLVRNAQDALTTAFQARRALETLREQQRATHTAQQQAADRAAMDDIALTRFHHAESLTPPDTEHLTHG
jgi:flagellar export protein FliJ